MVNRFGRSPGALEPFRPRANTPAAGDIPAVERTAGQEDGEALFRMGRDLAGVFGSIADRQAQLEGAREGSVAGNDPTFRPEGRTTLRGAAFERAAIDTYAANLDAKIHKGLLDAFQANRDNPAGFNQAVDRFKADVLAQDAFPQITGQVNATIERARAGLSMRTADALLDKQRDEQRASIRRANVTGEALVVRTLESAPDSPEAARAAQEELNNRRKRNRAAVQSGAMTADEAAKDEIAFERDLLVRQAVAGVEKVKTLDDLNRLRSWHETAKREGKGELYKDARAVDQFEAALDRKAQQLATQSKAVLNLTERAGEDMVSRAVRGTFPPAEEVAALRAQAAQAGVGSVAERTVRRLDAVARMNARGPEALEAEARVARQVAGPTPPKDVADEIRFLEDTAQARRAELQKDPVRVAERTGFTTVMELTVDDPARLAGSVRERIAMTNALPADRNPDGRMLKVDEVQRLNRKIGMGGAAAEQTVRALVDGAGRDAPRLMRELGGTAPELAQAGLLMINGRDQAARELLAGVALRNIEGGAKLREVNADAFGRAWSDTVGDAMKNQPDDQARIRRTAMTIAQYRLRNASDMKGGEAQAVYRDAIRDALGRERRNGVEFGGVARVQPGWWRAYNVIAPPDVRTDRFRDAIDAIRPEDLSALPVPPAAGTTPRQLRQAVPVAVPGGYRFALGDPDSTDPRFVRGQDGQPFVLPWAEISPKVRQRVPGAFEGGR